MSFPITSQLASLNGLPAGYPKIEQLNNNGAQVDFQKLLMGAISETNQLEHQAQQNVETRILGGDITSSEVYTSLRKSEMALKMMMQVRNKLLDAYQEIQQMRI